MRGATILAAGVQAAGAAVDEVPHRQHTVADLFSTAPVSFFVGNSTLGMKQPCDEAVIASGRAVSPCSDKAQRWIMAATILGSSMAFIDGTVVNVALAALQNSFGGTAV